MIGLNTSVQFGQVAAVVLAGHDDFMSWQGKVSDEMRRGSSQAEFDEVRDFRALAAGSDPNDVGDKIAANLSFNARLRQLTVPDADALGKTYEQTYRETYLRIRLERLANGGTLPSDPGQHRVGQDSRGGPLTDIELTRRAAAVAAYAS